MILNNTVEARQGQDAATTVSVRGEAHRLDRRYGEIGISAVAAALRYQSEAKNPAYAPVVWQPVWWAADMAA